ncbi:DAK2 domain-containing protein [Zhihengliuella sp.]|uniref:DAK2 domain-containing protein n=1 Tax=Zhihengliuella sp. TaxID=1954483 RepID=UPI00281193E6|nr:DAK2 domain-containing protein [Zhihengliuella sp.]
MGRDVQQKLATGAQGARAWLKQAETVLGNHSDRLDAINVFPVPDGDTGTNLYQTVRIASERAQELQDTEDIGVLLREAAQAALENARGNSGTLLSVFLLGFAEPLVGQRRLVLQHLSEGLDRGQLRAWSALTDPVPGTMPSAMSAANEAVNRALEDSLRDVDLHSRAALLTGLDAAVEGTRLAVVASEGELDLLTRAQVVDAGAMGFLLVLEALKAAVVGEPVDEFVLEGFPGYAIQDPHIHATAEAEEGVEVMCSMSLSPLDAALLRGQLDDMGESVIMSPLPDGSGEATRWRVHVHVPEAAPVLEMFRTFCEPENVTVTSLSTAQDCA